MAGSALRPLRWALGKIKEKTTVQKSAGGAIEGLLRVPGYSGVVGCKKADKLPNTRTRGIRVILFSVSLPKCFLKNLLGK